MIANIDNSGSSILWFYLIKIASLIAAAAVILTTYINYSESSDIAIWVAAISIPLLFVSDAVALPVFKSETEIKFHHLWRTSKLKVNDAHIIDIGSGESFSWQKKKNDGILIATVERYYNLYIIFCDDRNKLFDIFNK